MRGVVTTQRVSTGQSDMSAQTRSIVMPGRCGQNAKYIESGDVRPLMYSVQSSASSATVVGVMNSPVSVHVLQVLVAGKKYDPAGQSAQEVASVVIVHVPEAHFGPTSPPDMVENLNTPSTWMSQLQPLQLTVIPSAALREYTYGKFVVPNMSGTL
jgi:hypothetical protein